jgi:hypothetical protein
MSREDQYNITVVVQHPSLGGAGKLTLGTWDKMSGGDATSEETKYRPGAMGSQLSLGGPQSTENVTVSRLYRVGVDDNVIARLLPIRGKAAMTVSKQSLTVDGGAVGRPLVFIGRLMNVKMPDVDSESNDPAMVELEMSTSQVVLQAP